MKIYFKYLGIPIGDNLMKQQFWQELLDKVNNKLSRWKGKLLSFTGRVCLITFVLSALPLLYLSLFKIPKIVCKMLTKIQRNLLWGWELEDRKISWTKWETLCNSKDEGWLGIRDIETLNCALLTKWKWRLGTNMQGLWLEVLEFKYGSRRNLYTNIKVKE